MTEYKERTKEALCGSPEAYDNLLKRWEEGFAKDDATHPYYSYEPWDVGPRGPEIWEAAEEDGVDLDCEELMEHVGRAPHTFQTGYLLTTKFFVGKISANRVGKSMNAFVKMLAMLTGVVPISLRYNAGVDTGIKRPITQENALRFGQRDARTGELLETNLNRSRDPKSWDCGNIIGAGLFPTKLFGKQGSFIRLASNKQVLEDYWTKILYDNIGNWIPQEFLDNSKGVNGVNKGTHQVYFLNNTWISIMSYDVTSFSLEGEEPIFTLLDEEPRDIRIKDAVISHTKQWSLITTPYRGITWSKGLFFPEKKKGDSAVFHATAYDSPYVSRDMIQKRRQSLSSHEIAARIWGLPTSQTGQVPFYAAAQPKLSVWINRLKQRSYELVRFVPEKMYNGIITDPNHKWPGLMDVRVKKVLADKEDERNVWRLYRDREDGMGYLGSTDLANGAETPEAAGDKNAGGIGLKNPAQPDKPILCATIRSSILAEQYAWEFLMACRYFNNALLCPESGRIGAANAAFAAIAKNWPFWYMCNVESWSTRKRVQKRGFDVNPATRDAIFLDIADWFDSYEVDQYPDIPDEMILKEAQAAEVKITMGGKAKCDHRSDTGLDSLTMFGIMLHVFKSDNHQIIDRSGKIDKVEKRERWALSISELMEPAQSEPPCYIGEFIED